MVESPTADACYKVVPETIGQFTGVTDENGVRIFEGDMVVACSLLGGRGDCGVVKWSDLFCAWHIGENISLYGNRLAVYEVVGNIYDGRKPDGM